MGRRLAWAVALFCVLSGAVVLWLRLAPTRESRAQQLARRAFTEGRRVALEGRQEVEMPGPGGRLLRLEAEVLTSRDGRTRIQYLSPPLAGVTVWESARRTYRFNPRLQRLTVSSRRDLDTPPGSPEELLLDNYTVRVLRQERIAGRPATTLELRPRSGSDRWKVVSVDALTGVVLASSERRGRDTVLRSTRFTRIRYFSRNEAPPASAFEPPAELVRRYGMANPGDTSSRFAPEALSALVKFRVQVPQRPPAGFRLRGAYLTPCPCGGRHQGARLEYSDGLSSITLFQCAHNSHQAHEECYSGNESGALSAQATVRSGNTEWHFLAVGDAPHEALEALIREVSLSARTGQRQ
jgi:hypothetical protein